MFQVLSLLLMKASWGRKYLLWLTVCLYSLLWQGTHGFKTWGRLSHCAQSGIRGRNADARMFSLFCSFYLFQDPSPWDDVTNIQDEFLFLLNISGKISADITWGVSPRWFHSQSSWHWILTVTWNKYHKWCIMMLLSRQSHACDGALRLFIVKWLHKQSPLHEVSLFAQWWNHFNTLLRTTENLTFPIIPFFHHRKNCIQVVYLERITQYSDISYQIVLGFDNNF